MAVVEMSARIVLVIVRVFVIVRFLPLAYSSAGTAAQSARLLLSGNTSPGWPACPALHARFAKVHACSEILHAHILPPCSRRSDRTSVVLGKSVSVSVDLDGRLIIKKKNRT